MCTSAGKHRAGQGAVLFSSCRFTALHRSPLGRRSTEDAVQVLHDILIVKPRRTRVDRQLAGMSARGGTNLGAGMFSKIRRMIGIGRA